MEVRTLEHKDIEKSVAPEEVVSVNFIEAIINKDNETGKYGGRVLTRFPPEPNGYLHIGHAKSICLNFGIGKQYNGLTNLRFDDTNPVKEDVEYVNSIMEDVKWLGFDWNEQPRYASDYFDQMYEYAKKLITLGKAYVDDQTADEIKQNRGDFSTPGVNSPYRDRSVEENLALFEEMKAGKYKDGEKVLRAKIDMAHPNIVMRDPVIYRIVNTEHHNTGNEWKIYPMYDFAHPIEDAIERITHSICTLEFEVHRPLYDWVLEEWDDTEIPQQIEFARLNVTKMVMSKRKLRALVEAGLVAGWDDPRMPTISGLRRRGYTPESIRDFCDRIGVAKADSVVDIALLEFCIREDLKLKATRPMVVVDPVTRKIKYEDASITPNTRVGYPIHYIPNAELSGVGGIPKVVIFLTADSFGVLPPISRLSQEAAMYHSVTGFTAKLAGTELGVKEPVPTFSTCFGEPIMPMDPSVYAEMLGERLKKHNTKVYLINTGWSGGAYGTGKRLKHGG